MLDIAILFSTYKHSYNAMKDLLDELHRIKDLDIKDVSCTFPLKIDTNVCRIIAYSKTDFIEKMAGKRFDAMYGFTRREEMMFSKTGDFSAKKPPLVEYVRSLVEEDV